MSGWRKTGASDAKEQALSLKTSWRLHLTHSPWPYESAYSNETPRKNSYDKNRPG